jgi:hypothetical protein
VLDSGATVREVDDDRSRFLGVVIVATGLAIVAAGATWIFFSFIGPDLRPTCSARPSPDPPFGPNCFNGPRTIVAEAGMVPALIVFVTVLVVVAIAWRLSAGRRPRD